MIEEVKCKVERGIESQSMFCHVIPYATYLRRCWTKSGLDLGGGAGRGGGGGVSKGI